MITEAILSLLSGGATGVIGSAVSKFSEYKTKKIELEHTIAVANIETTHIKLEAERDVQIAERSALSEERRSADDVLSASYLADKATYTGKVGIIDGIRGLMRPFVTLYTMAATSWVAFALYTILEQFNGTAFSGTDAFELWKEIVMLLLYLTATTVTWWFGTRPAARR